MPKTIQITKVENGYLTTENGFASKQHVFKTIDEMFYYILNLYEFRHRCSEGEYYGDVIVKRGKEKSINIPIVEIGTVPLYKPEERGE
jgi:hypothetical protein